MKTTLKLTLFLSLFILVLNLPTIHACTIISAIDGDTILLGGNEDQQPNKSFLVVNKKGTYGAVYIATPWKKWPLLIQTGINEMGLAYDSNAIPPEKLNPNPDGKPITILTTNPLGEISSVEDEISTIHMYNWNEIARVQSHFADKTGDAAVIYPGTDGEMTFLRIPKNIGYMVSTNFNLAKLKTGDWQCFRYKTAEEMLSKRGENDLNVEFMASVLKATKQDPLIKLPNKFLTLYSVVYDLKNLKMYIYYNMKFDNPYIIDVKDELAKTDIYKQVPLEDYIAQKNKK